MKNENRSTRSLSQAGEVVNPATMFLLIVEALGAVNCSVGVEDLSAIPFMGEPIPYEADDNLSGFELGGVYEPR